MTTSEKLKAILTKQSPIIELELEIPEKETSQNELINRSISSLPEALQTVVKENPDRIW